MKITFFSYISYRNNSLFIKLLIRRDIIKMNNKNLDALENESISIIRDTYSSSENPVLPYSVGKDSSVLTHLFKKAFYPLNALKLLHVDTTWKFKEMIKFRDDYASKNNLDLIVYKNQEAIKNNITPLTIKLHRHYEDRNSKKVLDEHGFDMIYGGARRDEEARGQKRGFFLLETSIIHGSRNKELNLG